MIVLFISFFLCFRYDHQERLTAVEAQLHPYFDEIRAIDPNPPQQIVYDEQPSAISTSASR